MTDKVQITVSAKDMRLLGKALRVYRARLNDRLVVALEEQQLCSSDETDLMAEIIHSCRTLHRTLSMAYDDVFDDSIYAGRRRRLP